MSTLWHYGWQIRVEIVIINYNHFDQMLSRKTIENLTDKLMVEVANYVTEDPRFTELLNELVP